MLLKDILQLIFLSFKFNITIIYEEMRFNFLLKIHLFIPLYIQQHCTTVYNPKSKKQIQRLILG